MLISLTRTLAAAEALLLLTSTAHLRAQTAESSAKIQIIPAPKQVTAGEGSFALRDARVVLADAKSAEDQFAAQDFINDVKTTFGASLAIARGGRRDILIGRIDSLPIAQALKRMNATAPATLGEEGYVVVADANQVFVAANTAAGTFYGLQTLKQLVRGDGATAFI